MQPEVTYPVVRIYFNSKEDDPLVWSIDDGDQANEINVANITTFGVSTWIWNGVSAPDKDCPRAWVQFHNARMHYTDEENDKVYIENE